MIRGPSYLGAGSIAPDLPGFRIEAVKYWLHAIDRRGRRYLIESRARIFVLHPITDQGSRTTTIGPPGPVFPKAEVMPGPA